MKEELAREEIEAEEKDGTFGNVNREIRKETKQTLNCMDMFKPSETCSDGQEPDGKANTGYEADNKMNMFKPDETYSNGQKPYENMVKLTETGSTCTNKPVQNHMKMSEQSMLNTVTEVHPQTQMPPAQLYKTVQFHKYIQYIV